ncbi:GtrA family protein [Altererythrobacter sp.]|uniref:GtrA family protein n=1 Tax=Altererythrobacter sp. TaxID=1872480 RepID=UPI003D0F2800
MVEIITRLRDFRLVRYLFASAGALAVDMGTFLALLALGMMSAPAAAAGYSMGILAHWLLSSRTVFQDSVARRGAERTRQKALFVISALLGLGLTTLVVGLGDWSGLDPRLAKLAAIVLSFALTYLLRKSVVFRGKATDQ